ncbi:MAG TPA: hypothetical protein VGQ99_08765 [Tepidisphaeraceae bacterium]|jgi:hypothetical protein|nr:hypothetical protein [Tepidisphaeraceae bacterium]
MAPPKLSLFLLACALAALCPGCRKEEPIKAYQAPKEPAHVHHERLEWKVPGQWIEWPGDEQTYAGFTLEEADPPLEMTISALPRNSPSAADVQANVNRWQRQLGLPASSPEEVNQLATKVVVDERPLFIVDLLGPPGDQQKRILGAMVVEGDRVWFFKATGPTQRLAQHKQEFNDFILSLKFNGPKDRLPQRETKNDLSWIAPAGWENGGDKPLRALTFFAGDPNDPAEVMVTPLGGTKFGDLLTNINRWRAQVGLPPVAKADDQPTERIQLAGHPAAYFDFTGPGTPQRPNQRLLLVMTALDNDVWFFKMIGPKDTVAAEKSNFDTFLKSVQFVAEK